MHTKKKITSTKKPVPSKSAAKSVGGKKPARSSAKPAAKNSVQSKAKPATKAAAIKKGARPAVKTATKPAGIKKTARTSVQAVSKPAVTKPANGADVAPAQKTKKSGTVLPAPIRTPAVPPEDSYQPGSIEAKWQQLWEQAGLYRSVINPTRPKFYALTMLPYPSGNLHIGHWYAMTPSDARARFKRMQGHNVLFPMGFDAFGLPAENAAIKDGVHPMQRTYANIKNMRQQLRSMGAMFDWQREAVSCDPEYYRWTQWFFAQLFRHGLAYKKWSPVDWCPHCNTTLAREQVWGDDRHCERCKTPVIKKNLDQWYFRTTKYAEELLDFDGLDWPDMVRDMQTHWIGRSEGAQVIFSCESGDSIEVFTTRPDTLWGATFMVLAPEHPLVAKLVSAGQKEAVDQYVGWATRQTDIDRESTEKEKTGVFTGAYAVNPVNNVRVPIWIADYVLMTYGTGAIMAVPAHDTRDFEFALKYGLPILPVIERTDGRIKSFALGGTMRDGFADALRAEGIPFEERDGSLYITIPSAQLDGYLAIARAHLVPGKWNEVVGARWLFLFGEESLEWDSLDAEQRILERCQSLEPNVRGKRSVMEMLWAVEFYRDALYHSEYGRMINSGECTGTPGDSARRLVGEWLAARGRGKSMVTFRLRDWLISRQRYWGSPIPIVYCETCGQVAVPDDQLPVRLPEDVAWLPTGESPLKLHPTWSQTTCPTCGGPATRDTDTMDTFMCSSWYHLRYLSPKFESGPFDPKEYDYWMPVDSYTGGAEHATMHLIYTRFFHKACRDMGITRGKEPMLQLRNQGQILGPDGQRMSKSRGNVIDPDEQVRNYGADAVRAFLMFGYHWAEGGPWNADNIQGSVRWLNRVWILCTQEPRIPAGAAEPDARALARATHQTIRKITRDLEKFEFNTVISALMEFTNTLFKFRETSLYGSTEWHTAVDTLLLLAAPECPHITEELWRRRKGSQAASIHLQSWPAYDAALAAEDAVTIIVQVNGKLRERLLVPIGAAETTVRELALASEAVTKWLEGKPLRKAIYIQDKVLNLVV
jgi:leucyl-tRNA synthetase